MESSIEKLEGLAHRLTIEIPAEKIDQAVTKRLQELNSNLRINGFRRGKVPPHVLKQRHGAGARQNILEKQIEDGYRTAVKDSDCSPAAKPEIELISGIKEGEALKFTAVFEVLPEVQVKGLDKLTVTLPKTEITEQDIDETILNLRHQRASFIEAGEAAREDDLVTIDFAGEIEGKSFADGSGKNVDIMIGEQEMLPAFEDHLKGMKAGETKVFEIQFPEDYDDGEVAGKTARFTVDMKKVERMELPETDQEFIKSFGIDSGDLEAFRKSVLKTMTWELENANRRIRRERLFDAILKHNDDQVVPESSLREEIERMAKELNLEKHTDDEQERQRLIHNICVTPAKRRLQLEFLLGKLFEERNIELDPDLVNQHLDSIASNYENPAEYKKWYQNDRDARMKLASSVFEQQLIENLYKDAIVTEEKKTFREIMETNREIMVNE